MCHTLDDRRGHTCVTNSQSVPPECLLQAAVHVHLRESRPTLACQLEEGVPHAPVVRVVVDQHE
eukprot:scaffold1_cov402-Prasinococcus_capsulatus_cf.AAC.59